MSKTAKAGRAQNVEELFASVSTIQASGLNPPPQRIILTPRSAESCLKHGINPESLRIRDLDSFRESSIDPAIQRMRHEAYSQRRHEYMKTVRTARKKLYAAEGKPAATSTVVAGGSDNSAMIDIEQRRLQKIQQRQQKEIENMLQFELKMNEVAEEASRKADGDSKREAKMEADKMMRNKQMAEERRVRDLKKKAQEDTEEEQRQRVAYAMFLKDKEQAEAQARKKRLMEIEARAREEERKRKAGDLCDRPAARGCRPHARPGERRRRLRQTARAPPRLTAFVAEPSLATTVSRSTFRRTTGAWVGRTRAADCRRPTDTCAWCVVRCCR